MNTLIFDTETTGRANFNLPHTHSSQPRLAQLGALLYDENWTLRAEINLIVQPFGFDIPIQAEQVHGISTKIAKANGLPEITVLDVFDSLLNISDRVVAHNIQFDTLVIRHAWHVWMRPPNRNLLRNQFCTMSAMTDVCKLPAKFKDGNFKWPTLTEAYKHFFNEEFDNAHDAMADVRACARIYKELHERNKIDKGVFSPSR